MEGCVTFHEVDLKRAWGYLGTSTAMIRASIKRLRFRYRYRFRYTAGYRYEAGYLASMFGHTSDIITNGSDEEDACSSPPISVRKKSSSFVLLLCLCLYFCLCFCFCNSYLLTKSNLNSHCEIQGQSHDMRRTCCRICYAVIASRTGHRRLPYQRPIRDCDEIGKPCLGVSLASRLTLLLCPFM